MTVSGVIAEGLPADLSAEASAKAIAKAEMAQIGEKFRAMGEQIDICRDGGEEE